MATLKPFKYERPESFAQLSRLLAENQENIPCFLAGGTDLLVAIRSGKENPNRVIDLKNLPDLEGIHNTQGGSLWVGALTPIHSLEISPLIKEKFTALSEGAENLGSLQVRNRGTIGGNLANGAPTADTAAPLLALGAKILTWSPAGERRIAVGDFWLGAGKTCLHASEIITGIEISEQNGCSSAYSKLGPRKAMDIAIVSVAVVLKLDDGLIREVKIALGGAGSTPLRSKKAEDFLTGRVNSLENICEAGKLAASDSSPRSSNRASREYRLDVIPVLVERTINDAIKRQEDLQRGKGGKK